MLLPKFDCHFPSSVKEACQILDRQPGNARLLAGGTDILINMKRKKVMPTHLVALDRLDELLGIKEENGSVLIGARMTASEISENGLIREYFSVLAQGAAQMGSPLIRNRATVGGNMVTARPAADMALALIAAGATAMLAGSSHQREVAADDFILCPGECVLMPGEVLTHMRLPKPRPGVGGGFQRLGLRKAMEIAIVNVAVNLQLGSDGRTIEDARVALGSVAPTPVRSPRAEQILIGATADDDVFKRAAAAAPSDASPINDHRASAVYRKMMIELLTRRALTQALDAARRQ